MLFLPSGVNDVRGWNCPVKGTHLKAQVIESQITSNLGALQSSSRANFPTAIDEASIAINAAYTAFGGDLLGNPYRSVGHSPLALGIHTCRHTCASKLTKQGNEPGDAHRGSNRLRGGPGIPVEVGASTGCGLRPWLCCGLLVLAETLQTPRP
jgi:hypothetical protein